MPDLPTRDPSPLGRPTSAPSAADRTADLTGAGTAAPCDTAAHRPAGLPVVPGYELLDEVGRGGMGVVYRARDTAFGRDVAVKLLQDRFPATGVAARRFAGEARITGQLQHPGVPAAYQTGTLPDGRPFLAMKLIKGRTLDDLIEASGGAVTGPRATGPLRARAGGPRSGDVPGSPNLIAAFEGVCQAVGYAHARGVVHRDLKPAYVMVGSFGEVQVMDWGLAKVLADRRPDPADPDATAPGTEVVSTRNASDATRAGSLLGTPAYMAPEQAIGAVDEIDRRSDVFGLGAVLCVVLTGRPPYTGDSAEDTRKLAIRAELGEALGRLAGCGADPGLVALCKRCLAPRREDRPADGGAVAAEVARLRADADDRARRAEVERAAAEAEAREQRKRRRVQLALAAAVGLLVAGGVGAGWWQTKQADDRRLADERAAGERQRLEGVRDRQELLARQEKGAREERARAVAEAALARLPGLYDRFLWVQAEDGLAAADALLGPDGDPGLKARVAAARKDTALLARLDQTRLDQFTPDGGPVDLDETNRRYLAAFRDHGLDFATGDPDDLARRVADSPVRDRLFTALDAWLTLDSPTGLRKVAVYLAAGRHRWQAGLPSLFGDPDRLAAAYDAIPAVERTPGVSLGFGLLLRPGGADAVRVLEDGVRRHPADFWLHYHLGAIDDGRPDRQTGALRAALAVRPNNPTVLVLLADRLEKSGDTAGAVASLRAAVDTAPDFTIARSMLGRVLLKAGDPAGAEAAIRELTRTDRADAGSRGLVALALAKQDRFADAAAAYREAERLGGAGGAGYAKSAEVFGQLARQEAEVGAIWAGAPRTLTVQQAAELALGCVNPLRQRKRYAAAVWLYSQVFAAEPADQVFYRVYAARAALRLAAGDDPTAVVGWDEWGILQDQAFGWLAGELAILRKAATARPEARRKAAAALAEWLAADDFASVRDPARRAWMPAHDRDRWARFWAEVAAAHALAAPAVAPPPREAGR